MKRWNTIRAGMYGAFFGAGYTVYTGMGYWGPGSDLIILARVTAHMIGGAAAGFVLVTLICVIRNWIVRAR
ncbi:MAG: hypothetical protein ACHQAQ_12540 [Hyphomicrobiales bacterium]